MGRRLCVALGWALGATEAQAQTSVSWPTEPMNFPIPYFSPFRSSTHFWAPIFFHGFAFRTSCLLGIPGMSGIQPKSVFWVGPQAGLDAPLLQPFPPSGSYHSSCVSPHHDNVVSPALHWPRGSPPGGRARRVRLDDGGGGGFCRGTGHLHPGWICSALRGISTPFHPRASLLLAWEGLSPPFHCPWHIHISSIVLTRHVLTISFAILCISFPTTFVSSTFGLSTSPFSLHDSSAEPQ